MKILSHGDTVRLSEIPELGVTTARPFGEQARAVLTDAHKRLEIDLSDTRFIDSCGLGVLVALQKRVSGGEGAVRLLHPQPPVRQILSLTRMDELFEIVE